MVALAQQSVRHLDSLNAGTGPGNDFLGWLSLPDDILPQLDKIEKTAASSEISIGHHSCYRHRRIISWSKGSDRGSFTQLLPSAVKEDIMI